MPRSFTRHPRAFADEDFVRLREAVLHSPLIGRSTLGGSFRHSRGFAVTFRRDGVEALIGRFPFLEPYVRRVLEKGRRERYWFSRRAQPPRTNAFYLNVLWVEPGGEVGRHVDATLRGPSGVPDVTPWQVSVLYLDVPRGTGGELLLFREEKLTGVVMPRERMLVHFDGTLAHQVRPFSSGEPDARRVSLVCEQYVLPEEALERIPVLQIQSRAGFDAYLEDHRRRDF